MNSDSPCQPFTGYIGANGYGQASIGGRVTTAHRVAYLRHVGPIPDGWQVDHLCSNRACVNPAHLEAVTAAENVRRSRVSIVTCPRGHPYDAENTRVNSRGQRSCKECDRASKRRSRAA